MKKIDAIEYEERQINAMLIAVELLEEAYEEYEIEEEFRLPLDEIRENLMDSLED